MDKNKITRRKLIKDSAKAMMAGSLYLSLPLPVFSSENNKKSKVVLVRDKKVINANHEIDTAVLTSMFDNAVLELTGARDINTAWSGLVNPGDIVGIKTNVWRYLSTPSSLETIIKERLLKAGVEESNISIKDRGILRDEVFKNSTALINVRPLRTHHWSGLGTLLKNYIMFTPAPASYHPDSCADLAKLWDLPEVKGKTRLNVLVMLTPLFHGIGPHHYNREYTWEYNGLLLGFDPVAVDTIGASIIKEKRKQYFGEERPINPPPKHIYLADTRHHLGTADPSKIELVKLGWKEDIFV